MSDDSDDSDDGQDPGRCECGREHGPYANNLCPKCGACHFKWGEHIPDDMLPLSRCTKCGEIHLWD